MMVYFLIFYVIYLVLNAFENYYRDEEKFNMNNIQVANKYQKKWKMFQFIRWLMVLSIVEYFFIGDTLRFLIVLFIIGLLWTYLYDGILNILKKRNFFYVSMQTQSFIEKKISKYLRANYVIAITIMLFLITALLFITIGG